MPITLGLHLGHHASCAVVADGVLLAAVQQERFTRRKHDGRPTLDNRLPVGQCLAAAGIAMGNLDGIVSSFQSVAPGGVGLHSPLIDPNFDLFDAWDPRHTVISHHLAHAIGAFGCSGFDDAAVLVCDLGGSSTETGEDFTLSFADFHRAVTSVDRAPAVKGEMVSIYDVCSDGPRLRHREYIVAHPAPDIFVQSAASLYDNVSRSIFGSENAHGQLMALASLDPSAGDRVVDAAELISFDGEDNPVFRNDWQNKVRISRTALDNVGIARGAQAALQAALQSYARRARRLSRSSNFAAAGGVFLNIPANSEIEGSGLFNRYYFPSSPHDAGISVGCAFHGQRIWRCANRSYRVAPVTDRLGTMPTDAEVRDAIDRASPFVRDAGPATAAGVARLLADGAIVARCAGRSEFGPRALGGRSLLTSPLSGTAKNRLNSIKGRQPWRPVAPIVLEDRVSDFFNGPTDSPYMNYLHFVKQPHVTALAALRHADGSTRAQTLARREDEELFDTMVEFERLTGFPILVNTSLNGPGEPMVETAEQAMSFFRVKSAVDALILGDRLVLRVEDWMDQCGWQTRVRLAGGTMITVVFAQDWPSHIMLRGPQSIRIDANLARIIMVGCPDGIRLDALIKAWPESDESTHGTLRQAFDKGMLVLERAE